MTTRSEAAKKGWKTRAKNALKRRRAAKKGWRTRRRKAQADKVASDKVRRFKFGNCVEVVEIPPSVRSLKFDIYCDGHTKLRRFVLPYLQFYRAGDSLWVSASNSPIKSSRSRIGHTLLPNVDEEGVVCQRRAATLDGLVANFFNQIFTGDIDTCFYLISNTSLGSHDNWEKKSAGKSSNFIKRVSWPALMYNNNCNTLGKFLNVMFDVTNEEIKETFLEEE